MIQRNADGTVQWPNHPPEWTQDDIDKLYSICVDTLKDSQRVRDPVVYPVVSSFVEPLSRRTVGQVSGNTGSVPELSRTNNKTGFVFDKLWHGKGS